ncbi:MULTISPECIES: FMN-binding glutamate synthase family protein [Mycolicibacterium]|uniref:Glutamate synthase n=3 Tax=Mycolicibacterium TaxID=1866885 RepID=A0A0U1DNJ6_9MYCO|nr:MULTISPECIES: FMN-binding glutamate synthase family protein [Mycolicibacterium]MCV7338509.1 FMN-binding glutamate synthase family protein [Mycolicibacterium senegalense]MCW1820838.1 FMN-binding glutamate synthase family protein [Mycolicibacterium senegalense]OBB14198.1 glutamate synthase [Mycolicibacterium conceptionense]OBF07240.1 glutamate synthase [Mycolicibacterium conceptionense]OBF28119.1 glutamate synthase [Mycolicibacterium conceptionense]
MNWKRILPAAPVVGIAALAAYDLTQKPHALLRNFPVVGHLRYLLEEMGPELRQYIVASNDEERPFSRNQRRWIYSSSKLQNNYYGFGTDNNVEYTPGYPIIKHRTFAAVTDAAARSSSAIPAAKVLGGPRRRAKAFRPQSVVNVSAMSFGSMSAKAIEAINKGAALAGSMHNTGEGGLSPHHRNGGDLILQIGTAYFGCRDEHGRFDINRLKNVVDSAPVKAIEIKLSQGAKPGLGGMLPGAKVTPEIAEIRGIPQGVDCKSPSRHTEFHDVDSMLDWVEFIADETGLPVGIKSAVGNMEFWDDLVANMISGQRGVDFITVDGGEGGTGAAPLIFSESVAYPFRIGFAEVYKRFAEAGISDLVTFIGSGKLGLPDNAVVAFALGADMVNVGREIMLSIGCIQSQKCHTDTCPTGIATQNPWLARGLDPTLKSERAANYIKTLRRDLLKVSEACGVEHPGLIATDDLDILEGVSSKTSLREVYDYEKGWGLPSVADQAAIVELMAIRSTPLPGIAL